MPDIRTVREQIAWSYANLARAHAALTDGRSRYNQLDHMIRARLFKGLLSGRMAMRSLYDDERLKMTMPRGCAYCGSADRLSLDHLIPRCAGGADDADNLVLACRSCNSSKQGRDMLVWMEAQASFPRLMILRRYVKIVARRCDALEFLDEPLETFDESRVPFAIHALPHKFPALDQLVLWAGPSRMTASAET